MNQHWMAALLLVLVPLQLGAVSTADARDDEAQNEEQDSTVRGTTMPLRDRFTVHGFLSQAYATAQNSRNDTLGMDGPASPEVALGIPENGTGDYRSFAVQFGYEISPRDRMVVQLSHEANAASPADTERDDIELDWAFYARQIGDKSSIKVGRMPMPFGIYNEIRDVGVLLPFYRPSFAVYFEGANTNESFDGLQFSTRWDVASWSVGLDIYGGEFETLESAVGDAFDLKTLHARDLFGGQIWLNTPVSGLRLGAAGHRKVFSGGQEGIRRPVGHETPTEDYLLSLEADRARWSLRGEYRFLRPDEIPGGGFSPNPVDVAFDQWYAQIGWKATRKFHIYLQVEGRETALRSLDFVRDIENSALRDKGVSFYYAVTPALVLKAEYHELEAGSVSFVPVFTPQGVRINGVGSTFTGGSYSIVTLATSF